VSAALLLSLSAFGCQSLIDLEKRHVAAARWCTDYCDEVMNVCVGGFQVYSSHATCLAACNALDQGGPDDPPKSNTVYCRERLVAGTAEAPVDCAMAGPGGGDQCGSDCEGYCQILMAACDQAPPDLNECVRQCGALKHDVGRFNVSGTYVKGDSIQCRMYYASESLLDPSLCKNAVVAPKDPRALCTETATEPPKCEDYCRIMTVACTGDNAQYESNEQCVAACSALPLGTNGDSDGQINDPTPFNTVGCRKFHAYGALKNPDSHCHHSSPTSDGYCGDEDEAICESYCMLAKAACGAQYTARFSDDSSCEADCRTLEGSTEEEADQLKLEYSVATAKQGGANPPCRTLHALRVLEKEANPSAMAAAAVTECPIALGVAECPSEP
jgi:hypothetical protein